MKLLCADVKQSTTIQKMAIDQKKAKAKADIAALEPKESKPKAKKSAKKKITGKFGSKVAKKAPAASAAPGFAVEEASDESDAEVDNDDERGEANGIDEVDGRGKIDKVMPRSTRLIRTTLT